MALRTPSPPGLSHGEGEVSGEAVAITQRGRRHPLSQAITQLLQMRQIVRWANDLAHLEKLRNGLRQRMAASPLCDCDRFTGNFALAVRQAWRTWCAQGHYH